MTHARYALPRALRLLALIAAAALPAATLADDQADVTKLMRSGQLVQALAKAEQSLAAKPRDPQLRFLKGVVQSEMGRSADAIATYTQLTEDYPELPEPYNNLAVLYAGQSRFDKAREVLESAIRTNPGYAIAHENLGDVYARLASQSYGKAQQLDAANTTAAPKLELIRQLLSASSKGPAQPGR
jgi:Flp pilus assembly protein TadD